MIQNGNHQDFSLHSLPPSVCQMQDISLSGNVVPMQWFQTLTFDNGKPDTNSILILADIVYWHRPTEVRDERTGAVVGYKKKFAEDLLRKSYSDLEAQFGLSDRQLRDCLTRLENRGVIQRVFRTLDTPSGRINNVMYIALMPQKVKELTYGCGSTSSFPKHSDPIPFKRDTYHDRTGQVVTSNVTPITIERDTYPVQTGDHIKDTNTTSHTTPDISSLSHVSESKVRNSGETQQSRVSRFDEREKQMLAIWNEMVPSHSVSNVTPTLKKQLERAYEGVLGSSLSQWQTVCRHFNCSKFLMGEAEGVRIKPSLSWLLDPTKPYLEYVLLKTHFTFDDRFLDVPAKTTKDVAQEIESSNEPCEVKAVRHCLLEAAPDCYLGYLSQSHIEVNASQVVIQAAGRFALHKIEEAASQVLRDVVFKKFAKTLEMTVKAPKKRQYENESTTNEG